MVVEFDLDCFAGLWEKYLQHWRESEKAQAMPKQSDFSSMLKDSLINLMLRVTWMGIFVAKS
jgi:predicted metalloprotease